MDVVGIGSNSPSTQHWVYVPEGRVPFYRHACISNYWDDLPPIKSALMVDIAVLPSERVDVDAVKTKQYVG
jgi:hypothetical protein